MPERALTTLVVLAVLAFACESATPRSSAASSGGNTSGGKGGSSGTGGRGTTSSASSSGGKAGTGGTSGAGGTGRAGSPSGSGGTGGMRGTSGSGGTMGTGGASGAAGAKGTGGTSGAAGAKGTGGTSGAAGAKGTGGTSGSGGTSYTTNFDLAESPISESGAWHHDGLDWTVVETAGGIASNTQALGTTRSGAGQYNDSYAYLSGFPADQQASAVIHLGSIDTSCTHEVEILLRWADSAHNARGYECNLAYDGSYAEIVRWNGAVGDFTYLTRGSAPGGVHDGDVLSASIVGTEITLSVNGSVRASASDSMFATGNPGMGLWRGTNGCGSRSDYGFTSYTATSITP